MRNVNLHVDEGIVLVVRRLRGRMESRAPGRPPVFDDGRSYVLNVDQAELSIGMRSLERLLNAHVFAYEGAPLKDIRVRPTGDGRLEQKAKLHKGVTVPVSMKASVAPTPEGQLRLHVESMKAAGVPARGLLKLFGLELDDVVKLERGRGVVVRDDDLVISLGQVLPPPEMRGRLSSAFVRGEELVQIFGDKRSLPALSEARSEGPQLRVLPRRRHSLREADHERGGPAVDRCRSARSVRLLPGAVQRPTRRRLFEEHAIGRVEDLHARLQRSESAAEDRSPADRIRRSALGVRRSHESSRTPIAERRTPDSFVQKVNRSAPCMMRGLRAAVALPKFWFTCTPAASKRAVLSSVRNCV